VRRPARKACRSRDLSFRDRDGDGGDVESGGFFRRATNRSPAMDEDAESVDRVVDLLGDDYARDILVHTREEAKSVDALSDACDADPSTIYRRVERLQEADLLTDEQRLDPGGHHYKVYAASVREVRVRFDPGGVEVERDRTETASDRFTDLFEGFK
jgi:DNA-binding transcriptional ArsR family regulator